MSEEILRTGDVAIFNPNFSPAVVQTPPPMPEVETEEGEEEVELPNVAPALAVVTVAPGTLVGTGIPIRASQANVCVEGDEASVIVPGCAYMTVTCTIPGAGILSIAALGSSQLSRKTKTGGRRLMLKGTTFTAKFQVVVPASMPAVAPVPDPVLEYSGTGTFQTTNLTVKDNG